MFPYSLQERIEVTGFRPPEYISAICCGPEKRKAHCCYDEGKRMILHLASAQNFLVLELLLLYRIQILQVWNVRRAVIIKVPTK